MEECAQLLNENNERGVSTLELTENEDSGGVLTLNVIQSRDVSIRERERLSFSGVWSVYRGEYRGADVTIKMLHQEGEKQISANALMLQRELTVLSNLRHECIVPLMGVILDLETYGGAVAGLVTEFMHRGSLYDVLHLRETPPEHRLSTLSSKLRVLRDVADGLRFLHMSNVIHRDLKSPNVLLDEDGRAKICDFGWSHIFVSPNVSYTTAVVGTPAWSSPEALVNDAGTVRQSTDVYSFGVILWETLTNKIPWNGYTSNVIVVRVSRGESLPLDLITSGAYAPELVAMLEQCLSKNPNDRPTFENIVQCLSDVLPVCIEKDERTSYPKIYDVSNEKFNIIRSCDVEIFNRTSSAGFSNVRFGEYRGTNVAIKMLRGDGSMQLSADDPQYREIKILSNLRHPRIVSLMGVILDLEDRYGAMAGLVTEFMPRGSLYDVLHLSTTPPEHRLTTLSSKLRVLRDVADGMRFLHRSNVIHRDLKSPNVLLDEDGRAKICDFGLSQILNPNDSYTTAVVGTPAWSSPESLLHSGIVRQSTDVYSFGVILWETLTENIPWHGVTPFQIAVDLSNGKSLSLDAIATTAYIPEVVEMLKQCLATLPNDRPIFDIVVQCLSGLIPACIEEEGRQVTCPKAYMCPISHDIMEDPVICSDGHTYERAQIELWLQHHDTSPNTNLTLADKTLRSNIALKILIEEFNVIYTSPSYK